VLKTDPHPKVTKTTALAKEAYGVINRKATHDEIINIWQRETRGYKYVDLNFIYQERCSY